MTTEDAQRRREVRALAGLALDEIGGAVGGIGNIHRAISDRVFAGVARGVGSSATPVKIIHDAIAGGLYSAISSGASIAGRLAEQSADLGINTPPSQTVRGAALIAAIQGLRGDTLAAEGSELACPMSIRRDGEAIPTDATTLAQRFPDASGQLVVFLHGLMETEHAWRLGGRPTYGARLADDLGRTEIQIRFNSGLHISENARSLAELLSDLVENWPVEVEQIAIVGHSMGGLIARGACAHAVEEGAEWVQRVRHVVCLGSPHFGAPLERVVHYASAALVALPETRPVGKLLRRRSSGIRDLRQGSLVDDDWRDGDPDSLRSIAARDIPLLDGAMHFFVSATVTRSPRHPLGRIIGDGLVLTPSASGKTRARRIGFSEENGMHLSPANHFTLLNSDLVYEKLRIWLLTEPPTASDQASNTGQ